MPVNIREDGFNMTRHTPRDLASSLKAKLSSNLDGPLEAAMRELEQLRERVRQAEIAAKSDRSRAQRSSPSRERDLRRQPSPLHPDT
jgi:hypothetical protein